MTTFDYFKQICAIPRESGNEEGMRQYLISWAKENSLDVKRDKAGNIIIYCKATKGYENVKPIALQGHMDMVCVKTEGSKHDFLTDPIEVYQDGDFLRAKDTSLGGDNGIAVAMAMALMTDKKAEHGPIEAIFTFSEETGMDGAFALDTKLIKSRCMINIDSEEEGVIYIGCAGGIDLLGDRKVKTSKVPSSYKAYSIKLGGLKGGHSGSEIIFQRTNSISALSRMILALEGKTDFRIAQFEGGVRKNVIPFSSFAVVCVKDEDEIKNVLDEFEAIRNENKYEEPDFSIDLEVCDTPEEAMSYEDSLNLVKTLFCIPTGVYTMSHAIKGIVETSDNLAIVKYEKKHVHIETSIRSSIDSSKYMMVKKIGTILNSFGFETSSCFEYPSWTPDPDSKLANLCAKVWKKTTGKDAFVTAIHAGLECGVINSSIKGMDSVSIGPDLFDVHSVNEHLSISSVDRMYLYLKELLKEYK